MAGEVIRYSNQPGREGLAVVGGLLLDPVAKTLSSDKRWNVISVVAPSSVALDMTFPNHKLILGASFNLLTPLNMAGRAGQRGTIMIAQDVTGGRVLGTRTSPWLIEGGTPVLSTGGFAVDMLHYTLSDDLSFVLCSWHKGLA